MTIMKQRLTLDWKEEETEEEATQRRDLAWMRWVEKLPIRPAGVIYSEFRKGDILPFDQEFGSDDSVAEFIGFKGVTQINSSLYERCWIFWGRKCDALIWDMGNSYVSVIELWEKGDTTAQMEWMENHNGRWQARWANAWERQGKS